MDERSASGTISTQDMPTEYSSLPDTVQDILEMFQGEVREVPPIPKGGDASTRGARRKEEGKK
jgi:hypothetical protein